MTLTRSRTPSPTTPPSKIIVKSSVRVRTTRQRKTVHPKPQKRLQAILGTKMATNSYSKDAISIFQIANAHLSIRRMPGAPQPKCALNYSPNSVRLPLPQGAAAGGGHLDRWMRSMDGKRPIKAAKAFTANDTPTPFGAPRYARGTPGRDTSANGLPRPHGPAARTDAPPRQGQPGGRRVRHKCTAPCRINIYLVIHLLII